MVQFEQFKLNCFSVFHFVAKLKTALTVSIEFDRQHLPKSAIPLIWTLPLYHENIALAKANQSIPKPKAIAPDQVVAVQSRLAGLMKLNWYDRLLKVQKIELRQTWTSILATIPRI
jgi:hypothetical protein